MGEKQKQSETHQRTPAKRQQQSPLRVETTREQHIAHPLQRLQRQIGNARIMRMLADEESALWTRPEVALAGGPISNRLASRIYQNIGRGKPLDASKQSELEEIYGVPLDDVRIHDDQEADMLSRSISARAFTLGHDIFFSRDADPSDDHLLRHEITHVVQQQSMSFSGPLTVGPADDAFEREATQAAEAPAPSVQEVTHTDAPSVQRDLWDELNVGNISGILGTGGSILQGIGETAIRPLADLAGTTAPAMTRSMPGLNALGGVTSVLGLVTGTQDMLNSDKPWYERVVGGMSAAGGLTGTLSTVSSLFGSSLFAAGGSTGLTAGAGTALTGGGAGLFTGAGAATALGSLGAVLGAGAAGYGAGRILDEGVNYVGQLVTGDTRGDYSLSGGLASVMTSADRAISSLWADPSKPAYTQTIGWKLADFFGI